MKENNNIIILPCTGLDVEPITEKTFWTYYDGRINPSFVMFYIPSFHKVEGEEKEIPVTKIMVGHIMFIALIAVEEFEDILKKVGFKFHVSPKSLKSQMGN